MHSGSLGGGEWCVCLHLGKFAYEPVSFFRSLNTLACEHLPKADGTTDSNCVASIYSTRYSTRTQACAALEAMTFALLQDLQDSPPPAAAAGALPDKARPTAGSHRTQQLSGSPAAASVVSNAGEGRGVPAGVGDGDSAAAPRSPPPGSTAPEVEGAMEGRSGATLSR